MKKYLLVFIALMLCCIGYTYAKTYENYYGITMEEDFYKSLCDIYGENYVYFLTEEEFNYIKHSDLSKVEKVVYELVPNPLISPLATHETEYKIITLINNNGMVTLELVWKKNPIIRSYDVMGVRFQGVKLDSPISFKQFYRENGVLKSITDNSTQKFDNGFGISFKLSDKSSLESSATFIVSGSGKVFGTYQHAASNISLNDSKKYTISSSGLGGVLKFADGIGDKYDRMAGVNISI